MMPQWAELMCLESIRVNPEVMSYLGNSKKKKLFSQTKHGTELLLQAEGKKTFLPSTAASQEKLAMVEFHSLVLFLLGSE